MKMELLWRNTTAILRNEFSWLNPIKCDLTIFLANVSVQFVVKVLGQYLFSAPYILPTEKTGHFLQNAWTKFEMDRKLVFFFTS